MTLTKTQLEQLQLLHKCPQKLRKKLLEKIDIKCIKAICECCMNTLQGNIPLTKHQKKSLSNHKSTLRTLKNRKISLVKKRKLIIQKGGFLNVLIPAALSVLTGLINGVR
jgi:hypothetical protein